MPILRLIAQLGLDKTGFDAGLDSAGKRVTAFGGSLKNQLAGAFSIAAITAFTRNLVQSVSHVNDLSEKLGVSAESLQAMDYAAKQSGSSIDAVSTAFRALSKARLEALQDPNSKAGQVFSALGIDNAQLKAKNLETIFRDIAKVIQSTDFGASEIAMVSELLGRSGDELLPMFKAGLEESMKSARDLGLVISEEVVGSIDDAGDALDRMSTRLKSAVAPAVEFVAKRITDLVDFMDMIVGGAGALIGGVAGGASFKDAAQMAADHAEEVLDKRMEREAQAEERAERRRQGLGGNPEVQRAIKEFAFAEKEKPAVKEKRPGGGGIESDAFGRIGAFTGASTQASLTANQARMVDQLNKIHDLLAAKGIIVKDSR